MWGRGRWESGSSGPSLPRRAGWASDGCGPGARADDLVLGELFHHRRRRGEVRTLGVLAGGLQDVAETRVGVEPDRQLTRPTRAAGVAGGDRRRAAGAPAGP